MPPDRDEPGPDEADAAQARRVVLRVVPVALLLFLGPLALALVPRLLAERSPGLARTLAISGWIVLPLLVIPMVASVLRSLGRARGRAGAGAAKGGRPAAPGCEREPPP